MRPASVTIYLGSNPAVDPHWLALAGEVGRQVAQLGLRVVYGGARNGMMGALANGALAAGGNVFGVLPRTLRERELAHPELSEFVACESMHERKQRMFDEGDAYLALPGGYGTLDELFEILCWVQIGHHAKPVALLNERGYYDSLLAFLSHANRERFLPQGHGPLPFLEVLPSADALTSWLAPLTAR